MVFSDTEKLILRANRMYKSTEDKLNYVNIKLNALNELLQPKMVGNNPINSYVSRTKFYRVLGAISQKVGERVEKIARQELEQILEMHDEYEYQLNEVSKQIELADADNEIMTALSLRKFYFEHSVYLTAIREEISNMHDEGALRKVAKTNNYQTISA